MILIIFGIYALIAAKLQISRHYGLKGKGARIAGVVCIAFGLGFFAVFSVPIFLVTRAAGLPDGAAAGIGLALQIVAFIICFFATGKSNFYFCITCFRKKYFDGYNSISFFF